MFLFPLLLAILQDIKIELLQITENELREKLSGLDFPWRCLRAPDDLLGYVSVVFDMQHKTAVLSRLASLRSVHDILWLHHLVHLEGPAEDLYKEILRVVGEVDVPTVIFFQNFQHCQEGGFHQMKSAENFRVTCRRLGTHAFISTDLERDAGEVCSFIQSHFPQLSVCRFCTRSTMSQERWRVLMLKSG